MSNRQSDDELNRWMRRIEIQRLWQHLGDRLPPAQAMELSAAFMRYSSSSGDLRFLNTALKLNDELRKSGVDSKGLAELEVQERQCLRAVEHQMGLI